MKNRAREVMFWPEMNNVIDNRVGTCEICNKYEKKQRDETFVLHEILDTTWTNVGTDLLEFY